MASDLIPPPSPAGRPATPSGVPNLVELPPEPPRSGAQPAQRAAPGPSQFRNRFGFLLGALAGVVLAVVLLVVGVTVSSGDAGIDESFAPNWSKWQPTDTTLEGGAVQIAEMVGSKYKERNGQQLVLVQPGTLPDGLDIALRPASGPISVFEGQTVIYRLNGLGPNHSILGGTPSEERFHILLREALELALYTFRYLPDVQMVLTTLPPPPPDAAGSAASPTATDPTSLQRAIFYRPGDLKQQLQIPLGETIPAKTPTAATLDPVEAKNIEALTLSNEFLWQVQQTGPTSGLLVLNRPPK